MQKIYSYEEITAAFTQAGFSCVQLYSDMNVDRGLSPLTHATEKMVDQDNDRLHFVLKKN